MSRGWTRNENQTGSCVKYGYISQLDADPRTVPWVGSHTVWMRGIKTIPPSNFTVVEPPPRWSGKSSVSSEFHLSWTDLPETNDSVREPSTREGRVRLSQPPLVPDHRDPGRNSTTPWARNPLPSSKRVQVLLETARGGFSRAFSSVSWDRSWWSAGKTV